MNILPGLPKKEMGSVLGSPSENRRFGPLIGEILEGCQELDDCRHHAAVLPAIFAAPGKFIPLGRDSEFSFCRFENAHAVGYDLFADPVTGNYGLLAGLNSELLLRFS